MRIYGTFTRRFKLVSKTKTTIGAKRLFFVVVCFMKVCTRVGASKAFSTLLRQGVLMDTIYEESVEQGMWRY